jgi:predicted dehydrogenase
LVGPISASGGPPLVSSAAEASEIVDVARRTGRLLQVALLSRLAQPGRRVADRLRAGAWGSPICFSAERLWPGRGQASHHGDALEELALFDFDYAVATLGMPRRVTAIGPPSAPGRVDHALVALEHDRGVAAFVEASRILPASFPFEISARLVCERAMLEWRLRFVGAGPPRLRVAIHPDAGPAEVSEELEENPYEAECRHFVQSIRGDADPSLLSGEAALEGLRVLDAARRSLAEGRSVTP